MEETNRDGGFEFLFHVGVRRRVRVHVVWFGGDLPAVKKASGVKGHNGKRPCRYCFIQGEWCPVRRHMYYPSTLQEANGLRLERRSNANALPRRSVQGNRAAITQIEGLRGQRRSAKETECGICGDSVLFRLPTIVPYKSFPMDVMLLFYNIGKDLLRLWCGTQGQPYELGTASIKQIDEELLHFGSGVASQLGSRPRPLSKFGDWKSAEFMA